MSRHEAPPAVGLPKNQLPDMNSIMSNKMEMPLTFPDYQIRKKRVDKKASKIIKNLLHKSKQENKFSEYAQLDQIQDKNQLEVDKQKVLRDMNLPYFDKDEKLDPR